MNVLNHAKHAHSLDLDPYPYFCIGQKLESKSISISESGNVIKPLKMSCHWHSKYEKIVDTEKYSCKFQSFKSFHASPRIASKIPVECHELSSNHNECSNGLQVLEKEKGALVHSSSIQSTDSSSGTDTKRTVHFEEVSQKLLCRIAHNFILSSEHIGHLGYKFNKICSI